MELLCVEHESCADAVILQARGDVDSSTVEELITHLTAALQTAARHPARLLIVDLQSVNFFGSAGLNAVLDCHEAGIAAGAAVRVVADHVQVLHPIRITELDRVFDIYPTMSAALRQRCTEDSGPGR